MTDLPLRLAGLTPFTTIDFPGHLAAVCFLQGCPWRCCYCHNPQMQTHQASPDTPTWKETLDWLQSRRGLLNGVAFSGGEPLLQKSLSAALQRVREMDFATALHTGGALPERLYSSLPYLDWVGFDYKAPFGDYSQVTQTVESGKLAQTSLHALQDSQIDFEIRTTVDANIHNLDMLQHMHAELKSNGIHHWILQPRRLPDRRISPHARTLIRQALTRLPNTTARGLD